MLINLFKIIGKTRDINGGKGEYTLSYMMIWTWFKYFPDAAKAALSLFFIEPNRVNPTFEKQDPYGSWKDIKYFCKFLKEHGESLDHPLISEAIRLTNEQLRKDINCLPSEVTLAAKWVPREKSSFGWLYQAVATDYYKEYMATADSRQREDKAILKCKTEYRKLLSCLNKKIDTLQIKQCANLWSDIDFKNVTSISLSKQKKAFLNVKKNNEVQLKLA
jgi:hypothetical protein